MRKSICAMSIFFFFFHCMCLYDGLLHSKLCFSPNDSKPEVSHHLATCCEDSLVSPSGRTRWASMYGKICVYFWSDFDCRLYEGSIGCHHRPHWCPLMGKTCIASAASEQATLQLRLRGCIATAKLTRCLYLSCLKPVISGSQRTSLEFFFFF